MKRRKLHKVFDSKSIWTKIGTFFPFLNWDQGDAFGHNYMGLAARKPVFGGLRTTNAQTSLRIRAV